MILNETLQRHRQCMEGCHKDYLACNSENDTGDECRAEYHVCWRDCDFDHGA